MGLEQGNNLKTTYTASAAIMVECISWATKEQGVPVRRHLIALHTDLEASCEVLLSDTARTPLT